MPQKIFASFYKVQYENIKRDAAVCAYVFVSNSIRHVSAKKQTLMTSDRDITKIKR